MTYDEFKEYLLDHLWKRGDAVIIDRLDTLIVTAEAELNRTFKVEDRTQISDVQAIDNLVQLPGNYREMRVLSNGNCPEMKYWVPAKFYALQAQYKNGPFRADAYSVVNRNIALAGTVTSTKPVALTMVYYMDIPKFKETGASWLCDDYFDVYVYCVLKHTAPFLREDERVGTWQTFFNEAFGSAMNENDDRKYAGSPLKIAFPTGVR